jgi:predicted dehydrogenase/threonine dehydrogenase-like Zn-dependent dehydrogenase
LRQIIQNIRNGKLSVATVPEPMVQPGHVLIANAASVISAGTEKMTMDLARKSLLGKARERPDQVRRVLEKFKNEGFFQTLSQVREKLDEPMTMGYSSAGVVLAGGAGVQEFKPGDRVASNGPHAGVVCVPKHLCAHAPDNVPFDHAAFAVLGAIAMQGVRLSKLTLGETALVIGLGLIGQITVALLKAAGVRVIGTDLDAGKCVLAVDKMGADVVRPGLTAGDVLELTRGLGADAVLITASTKSQGPINLAANAVRQKGRVVLVGVVGLELDRRPFYFKEAEFVVSCSYGPGRYDPSYEDRGHDYPTAYVRWTEQRNIQAVLDLMGSDKLDVAPLISHRFPIEQAEDAYHLIETGKEPYLGVLLTYPDIANEQLLDRKVVLKPSARSASGKIPYGFIGVGNFARMVLAPTVSKAPGFYPKLICSAGGLSATNTGSKLGFEAAVTDEDSVFSDPEIKAVFVVTRHDQHATQVLKAIKSGKHVFVEKPLALSLEEIDDIQAALAETDPPPIVMVGFNRRFSPAARRIKEFFASITAPRTVSVRFNAGEIPAEHWTQDLEVGGGRIIGEACHGIDLATYLVGSPPIRVFAESVGGPTSPDITDDQCFITLRHADGSISNIAYLAGGDKAFPKERVEMFGGGAVGVIDDFREVVLCRNGKTQRQKYRGQDKGHSAEIEAFAQAVTNGGDWPISWEDLRAVSIASILAVRSIREGVAFEVG